MNMADRIQALRRAKGVSQEELADAIGVSRQAVSKWESEQSTPDPDKIVRLCDYFDTTADYLLRGIEPAAARGRDPMLYALGGTVVNFVGMLAAVTIWLERQQVYATGIGLAVMALGCLLYFLGQDGSAAARRAKKRFVRINVWILPLIPASCAYNIMDGLFFGYTGLLAPIALWGNSMATSGLFWCFYIGVCAFVSATYGREQR